MDARPILVAVDLGPYAAGVVTEARAIAAKLGCEVVLVHVYTLPRFGYPGMAPALLPDLNREIVLTAEHAAHRFAAQHGGLPIRVLEGEPSAEILEEIERTNPSLVVMGTHGRRGVARWLLGSVAERVVRRSPVPVMTLRAAALPVSTAVAHG